MPEIDSRVSDMDITPEAVDLRASDDAERILGGQVLPVLVRPSYVESLNSWIGGDARIGRLSG